MKMTIVGNKIKCGIQKESSGANDEKYIAEIETSDGDYRSGKMGIAAWGTSW